MKYKGANVEQAGLATMLELAKEIVSSGPSGVIALLAFAAFGVAWKALSVLESVKKKDKE